jgi:XTP/dITP diphosphohydrolase
MRKESGTQESRKETKIFLRSSFPNSFCRMRHLLLATRNAHKTREFAEILGPDFAVRDLSEEPEAPLVEETGRTFADNAILKALAISKRLPGLVVADDSGLEVEALSGAPGVYSARYAGLHATDMQNTARLLSELRVHSDQRPFAARFRCVLALTTDGKLRKTLEGWIGGTIVDPPRGRLGFGYDPVFQPIGFDQTFGELPSETKNKISHRAEAIRQLRTTLSAGLI